MAYLQNDDQNNPQNQQNQSGGAPVQTNGGAGNTGAVGGSNQAATSGSGDGNQFSNLQKFVSLNQNAPNTAATVNQNVNQGKAEESNNVSQATAGIGKAFNYDQNDMNSKVQNNDYAGLQKQLATTYNGPQAGTVDVGPSNYNNIQQQTAALGSNAGQQSLLQQQYGKSDYSSGQQNLDNFLQSRNSQFQQDAAAARQGGQQLTNDVNNQNAALNNSAATTAQQTAQGVGNLRTGLGNTVTGYQTDAQNTANADNTADQAVQAQVAAQKAALANGTSDAATLQNLGYDPNGYTYGTDLSQFINYTGGGANANNVMSQDTYNKFKNINQLLGNDTSSYDDSLAGTYQKGTENYDTTGLQNALSQGQQAYQASFQPQQNQLNTANQIENLVQQRDAAQGTLAYGQIQAQLNAIPGASNNGYTRSDWAKDDNLAKAQAAYNQAKAQSDSQYLKKIGVS